MNNPLRRFRCWVRVQAGLQSDSERMGEPKEAGG